MMAGAQLLKNIELKARCPDLTAARAAALALSPPPADHGRQKQIDTYFNSGHGRLKLREIEGIRSELIWYDRPDAAVSRESKYRLVPVEHPAALRAALDAAMGTLVQITKIRHVLIWHNVRIHLDEVESLGSFIEYEAVMTAGESETVAHERLALLCRAMHVSPADHLDTSYAQLLQRNFKTA